MSFLARIKAFFSTPWFNYGRALLYVALPAWLFELVKDGRLSQDHANLWAAVAIAVFSPALASIFAPNGWRTYFFVVAGAVQGLLVGLGGISNNALGSLVIALLGAVLTSGIAAANVHQAPAAAAPASTSRRARKAPTPKAPTTADLHKPAAKKPPAK